MLGDVNAAFSAFANAVLSTDGGEIVFGKNEAAAAPETDPDAIAAGATLVGTAQGFAGTVTATLTIADDLTIGSLKVDAPDETEGLGKRTQDADFTDQFVGKSLPVDIADIETVSGATITSTAVVTAINGAQPAKAEILPGATLEGSAQGFAGTVSVTVKLDDDLNIENLKVSAPDETEGLGKRTQDADFTDQFVGKSLPVDIADIETVSGATITSTAVVTAINGAQPVDTGALTVETLGSIAEGSVGLQSNGLAVVSADESYSGTLVGEFVYENGQLVQASVATPAPAAEEAADDEDTDALKITKPGFGDADVIISLTKADDGTIASLAIDASTQTPGLGQLCAEEAFTSQFVGNSGPFTLGENIDAVTGATITSTAVVDGVNELLASASDAEVASDALIATVPGFSDLDVIVSLTKAEDGSVASLSVNADTQTPGLGQLAAEEAFTSQFVGKSGPFALGENIDAVANATITSTAVVNAVNDLLGAAEEVAEDEPAEEAVPETEDADALTATVPGFSDLDVVVSLTKAEDGSIASLTVNADTQTPGLGQLAAEEAFTSQFVGKSGPVTLGENIDAVTGA
ncbi:MAG: FMN-binding protein, partial [Clostridia bacterium]|nr:FMN-binding protein [Clostridia bacterium]